MTEIANWRKSSRSSGTNGSCVEVGTKDAVVAVRDTKHRASGQLEFSRTEWTTFVSSII